MSQFATLCHLLVKQPPRIYVPTVGLVKAILSSCSEFLWEAQPRGPGLLVYNAHTGEFFRLWIVIIRLIEDSVGLAKPICSHKQPAYIGAPIHAINIPVEACVISTIYIMFFCVTKLYQPWHKLTTADVPKYQERYFIIT